MDAERLTKALSEVNSDLARINDPLEPLKVVSALKSELMKYEYRKANKPEDISPLDYTIMTALMLQVPTVPKKIDKIYPESQYGCPYCSCAVTEIKERRAGKGTMKHVERMSRCRNCGQLISWDIDEE